MVGAEGRGQLVVEVFVDVHQVEVQEPSFLSVDADEFLRGLKSVDIGSAHSNGGIAHPNGEIRDLRSRPYVYVKALGETEIAFHPSIAVEAGGLVSGLLESSKGSVENSNEKVLSTRFVCIFVVNEFSAGDKNDTQLLFQISVVLLNLVKSLCHFLFEFSWLRTVFLDDLFSSIEHVCLSS